MIGVKLLGVGIVASVAWPLAFMYPLYKLSISLLQIIHSWESNKRLNPQSLFELAQMLVMLYAVSRLVAILSIYSSVGYSSCLLGAIMLGVSMNPSLIKQGCAVMAPYMTQMDRALEHADVLLNYDKLMHTLSTNTITTTTTASSSSSSSSRSVPLSSEPQYSARVEELRDETMMAPATTATTRAGTATTATRAGTAKAASSASDVEEEEEDDDAMMIEEFNIDHFDGGGISGVIDLTADHHHHHHRNAAEGGSIYTSSHQRSTNTIRLRRKSSLCS